MRQNGSYQASLKLTLKGNSSADVVFEIYNSRSEKLMAKGSMTQVFVDPTTRKSMPIPDFYRGGVIENQPDLA